MIVCNSDLSFHLSIDWLVDDSLEFVAGIEMSNNNSKLYLSTDASAKDSDKAYDVINGLTAKSLTPVFLLTGTCSFIRRRGMKETFGINHIFTSELC